MSNVAPIQPGGGSGSGPGGIHGIELRVARLESDVDFIKRDVGELKTDVKSLQAQVASVDKSLAVLSERVEHLPGKGFIITALLATLAVVAALVTFADKLHALVAG